MSGTARFCCVWVGGGRDVRVWVDVGGEGGVRSSYASWVRAISFSLYFLGGGEERAEGKKEKKVGIER